MDWENIINFTTSDYIVIGIIAILGGLLLCIYWIYTIAYVVSKSWKYGVNPYVFGLVTLFTNLVGVAVFWIYVKSHTICRNCGKLQSRKDNNCSTCGTALYVKCSECGTRISAQDEYCKGCGKKMK